MKSLSNLAASLPQAALSALLGQRTRQITLETALTADNLVVERFTATEAVSAPFSLQIDCLSPSAYLDTARLAAEEITLRLMLADGRRRAWHGFVTACAAHGGDGGLARYRLTVGSWLERLRTRADCYVYQDKTALEIIEDVLADYPLAHYRLAVTQPLRKRSVCAQYRETDLAFIERLLAEEGLSYRFEHAQWEARQSGEGKSAQSRHCLVIVDNDAERPACAQASVRFHRTDATEREDGITLWTSAAATGTNGVAVASWDYKALAAASADASANAIGEWPALESFEARGAYRFQDAESAGRAARLRMQAHESEYLRFQGEGSVRALGAGERFALTGHFDAGASAFVALRVHHEAANNLGTEMSLLLGITDIEHGSYRNRLTAVAADAPIVPPYRPRPTAPEGQAAVVIAEGGAPLTTDRDHRIRIRFPWLRAPMANPMGDTAADPGQDDLSQVTAWVRVATAAAGPNWGAHHLPRAGTEVLLTFLDGDIDRPMVIAQLHNEQDRLPWPAADAALNTVLSGWHSHNLADGGYNQWVVDDNAGQLRMRLASSAANSQLNLGYVVSHGPVGGERGAWRGTGAELRTDAWAVVRAGGGLLLSTTARPQAAGTLLDMHEARGQLAAAQRTATRLSAAATSQQALALAATEAFDPLTEALDPDQGGRYPDRVNEQDARQAGTGNPTEHFGRPWLVAESPSTVALATQATTAVFAGRHLFGIAQADWHVGAGAAIAAAAANGVSLFSQRHGIRAIAAAGPVSIQAHTDALAVMADKSVTVTSSADGVEVLAQKQVVLHGGNSRIVLDGNAVTFETPGKLSVKGAGHPLIGPGGQPAALPALPAALLSDPMLVAAELLETAPAASAGTASNAFASASAYQPLDGTPAPVASNAAPAAAASGQRALQYVNFPTAEARWNDDKVLKDLLRQTRKPQIRVKFSKPGVHAFKIRIKPDKDNSVYSAGEKGRNANYTYTTQTRSYTTGPDGTKVVKDLELAAGGGDVYTFEVMDDKNQVVMTETLETRRRAYLQEIKMRGTVTALAPKTLDPLIEEFARHGLDWEVMPPAEMAAMPNVDPRDPIDKALLDQQVNDAYRASPGARYAPFCLAFVYAEQLALKRKQPLWHMAEVSLNHGQGVATIALADDKGKEYFLWHHLKPGEDWFRSAKLVVQTPGGGQRDIPIPRTRCRPVPKDAAVPEACTSVTVDVSGLTTQSGPAIVELVVDVVDFFIAGVSMTGTNRFLVATRAKWKPLPKEQDPITTAVHELGHKLGMVPAPDGSNWAAHNTAKLDTARYYYDERNGHFGPHCHYGLAPASRYEGADGGCVMFGAAGVRHFCPECAKDVRRADISAGWPDTSGRP